MNKIQIDNSFRWDKCPLCGSELIYKVGPINVSDPVLFSSTEISLMKIPEYWRCKECTSGFSQNIVTENDARNLYTHSQVNRWGVSNFDEEKTADLVLEIKKLLFKGARVLDVGCNTGELLDFCAKNGAQTVGVEYSELCRNICFKKGHETYQTIEDVPVEKKFDIIFTFDLVEHLYKVDVFLKKASELLRSGGKLIILTGNPGSLSAKLSSNKWWYVSFPEHVIFPSINFFKKITYFKLVSAAKIFNSKNYERSHFLYSLWKSPCKLLSIIVKFFLNKYSGQPLLDKDHELIVLTDKI